MQLSVRQICILLRIWSENGAKAILYCITWSTIICLKVYLRGVQRLLHKVAVIRHSPPLVAIEALGLSCSNFVVFAVLQVRSITVRLLFLVREALVEDLLLAAEDGLVKVDLNLSIVAVSFFDVVIVNVVNPVAHIVFVYIW